MYQTVWARMYRYRMLQSLWIYRGCVGDEVACGGWNPGGKAEILYIISCNTYLEDKIVEKRPNNNITAQFRMS